MKQFSSDNSPVELEILSGHLLFIDPLYFQDIIDEQSKFDSSSFVDKRALVRQFEEKIFEHSGGVLLGYKIVDRNIRSYLFDPNTIKKWDYNNSEQEVLAQQKVITTFGIDTASFLIIDLENYEKLINLISYDTLIDAVLSNQLDTYFDKINEELGNKGWAYVESKGVNTDSEFDGDGLYIVN